MKKLILIFCALGALTFQSCMKEYDCMCSSYMGTTSIGKMKAATKREADRACKVLGGDMC